MGGHLKELWGSVGLQHIAEGHSGVAGGLVGMLTSVPHFAGFPDRCWRIWIRVGRCVAAAVIWVLWWMEARDAARMTLTTKDCQGVSSVQWRNPAFTC